MSVQPEIDLEKRMEVSRDIENIELNPDEEDRFSGSNFELSRTLMPDEMENETYEVAYYFKQALTALSIHILSVLMGPFGIPLLRAIFGVYLIKNMQFRVSLGYVLSEFPNFCWTIYTILLVSIFPDLRAILEPLIQATFIMFLIRVLLTSLKYGYYTQKHWKKLSTKLYSFKDIKDQFLISVWIKIPERITKRELFFSFKRLNVDMKKLCFKFKKVNEEFKDYIRNHLDEEIENRKIKASAFAEYILRETVNTTNPNKRQIVIIPSLVYALIPYGLILYEHGIGVNAGAIGWVYMVFTLPYIFINTYWFLSFILVGIFDFSRKKMLQAQCTALLADVGTSCSCLASFNNKLDMLDMQTILSWYYMRSAFLDFGKRYTLRVFLYFSLTFPVCLLSIILVILMMFNLVGREFLYFFLPGVYLVIVVMVIMSYMISSAVSLNKYFSIHRDILLSNIAKIRSLQCTRTCPRKVNEKAISTILLIVEKLKQDEILHPVTVMGIKLDSSLYAKLAAVALSGLFALVRVVFS